MTASHEDEFTSEDRAERIRLMRLKGSYRSVGDTVFAALTPEDKAHLVQAIWDAARSQDDDWRCALGNTGTGLPVTEYNGEDEEEAELEEPITDEHVRTMCACLADAKVDYWTEAGDWDRLLAGAFGPNYERYRPLYESVPLGDDGTKRRPGRR